MVENANRKQFVWEANWDWGYYQDRFDLLHVGEISIDISKQGRAKKEFLCQRWKET